MANKNQHLSQKILKKYEKTFVFCLTTAYCSGKINLNLKEVSHLCAFLRHLGNIREVNMPLVFAPTNTNLTIIKILADDKLKKHLESLGILVDGQIVVLSASGGSVVVKIKDGRIALDGDLSSKIFVKAA